MRVSFLRTALIAFAGLGLAACGATATASTAAPNHPVHMYLSILTPDQLGGTEDTGPAYIPANFSIPANTDVTITITNFDAPDGLTGVYAKASGTKGDITYESIDKSADPNAPGKVLTFSSDQISHTFTITKLGLNVPILANARTTFTFHSPAAGTYDWQCFLPCGSGTSGWGGPMSTAGFMKGVLTVV